MDRKTFAKGRGMARTSDAFEGRLPPQNLAAERSVLGSILLENNAIDEVADTLIAAHFYSDAHQLIYTGILKLYENGVRGIDAVTLAEELDRRQQLDEVGGVTYLLEILETVPHAAHVREYAKIVRDRWIQRSLTQVCTEVLRDCYEGTDDTEDVLQKAERGVFQILESQESAQKIGMDEIMLDTLDRINTRFDKDGSISGLTTGFSDLDRQTNGMQPTELVILAARPSMGKTAFVVNIAEAVASVAGAGVLIFSLEQSKLELAERFLCIRARLDGHRLRKGELDDAERHALLEASNELSKLPLFIDDQPGRTVAQISAIARRLKRRDKLGVIIIDYLQLIEPEDKRQPREQQIAGITRRLKGIAKENSVPVIALSQLNRGVELREDKRPRLADLRESGAIEQDADIVMFLHRPDAYDPQDRPGLAEVVVAKHRSGPTGIVNLTWIRSQMRFEDFSNMMEPGF
jgi:replicative DNA helicase